MFDVESVIWLLLLGKSIMKKSRWKNKSWFEEEQNTGKCRIAVKSCAEKAVQ